MRKTALFHWKISRHRQKCTKTRYGWVYDDDDDHVAVVVVAVAAAAVVLKMVVVV